jgi:hypothetical protein
MRQFTSRGKNPGRFLALIFCLLLSLPVHGYTSAKGLSSESPVQSSLLSFTVVFPEPIVQVAEVQGRGCLKVSLDGALSLGNVAGMPILPVSLVKLVLPPLTTVDAVTVAGPSETFSVFKDLAPLQQLFDSSVYPSDVYDGTYQIGYCRGYSILSLAVCPVQYRPSQGVLVMHPSLTISVSLKRTATVNTLFRHLPEDEAWVKDLVLNPEAVNSYRTVQPPILFYPGGLCHSRQSAKYVIITTTTNGLDDWPTSPSLPYNWTSLMQRHIAEGLSAAKVTLQQIDACHDYYDADPLFNDSQAHVRAFCLDAYKNWGTQYILIGGDGESNMVPARGMDTASESNIDADIYWSNLDNNFNADHDASWGEEGDSGFDLYSELFLGRVTCDIRQDVSNWMSKSFRYADEVQGSILENAGFYVGDLGWGTIQGDDYLDFSAVNGTSNWLGPNPTSYPSWLGFLYGFRTWNQVHQDIPYNLSAMWSASPGLNPGWHGGSQQTAIQGMRAAINNDDVSLISSLAHADPHMVMDVSDTDWQTLYHNTHPFFLYEYGNHAGDFDAVDDGVLDTLLFSSNTSLAFGCILNTCYGWTSGTDMDTNSSSALHQKLFWDYLFDMKNNSGSTVQWQLGAAHMFSKDAMAPTINWTNPDGGWRAVIQGCTLFADPAQLLKPPRVVNHPPSVPTTPNGSSTGGLGIEYTFTTQSIDPDGDHVWYSFDWGDDTISNWIGPFPSGVTISASYQWIKPGSYHVRVKASDSLGSETNYSAFTVITVRKAVLVCPAMKGGRELKMTFGNTGGEAQDVEWDVTVKGGLLRRVNLETRGHIEILKPDTSLQMFLFTDAFKGFGKVTAHLSASAPYADTLQVDHTGFLLGPYLLMK